MSAPIVIHHYQAILFMKDEVNNQGIKNNILNGVDAINKLQLWHWIKTFEPKRGFAWGTDGKIEALCKETDSAGHSGASFAITMRYLQKMAISLIKDIEYKPCAICMSEEHDDKDTAKMTLECYHTFHRSCIAQIMGDTCPLCRGETVPEKRL